MNEIDTRYYNQAAYLTAAIFGVLAGLGGLRHGVGEMLQGNAAPAGMVFNSWVEGPIATNMGGEPAMTILPNLLATGALTLVISCAVVVWAALFVQRKNGGLVLVLLSAAMLLVGGGFGPPVVGILAGIAGTSIHASYSGWRRRLPGNVRGVLAGLWPWVFGACVINGLFLFVASLILLFAFGVNDAELFLNSFYFAVISLLLAMLCGPAYDLQKREENQGSFPGLHPATPRG